MSLVKDLASKGDLVCRTFPANLDWPTYSLYYLGNHVFSSSSWAEMTKKIYFASELYGCTCSYLGFAADVLNHDLFKKSKAWAKLKDENNADFQILRECLLDLVRHGFLTGNQHESDLA